MKNVHIPCHFLRQGSYYCQMPPEAREYGSQMPGSRKYFMWKSSGVSHRVRIEQDIKVPFL